MSVSPSIRTQAPVNFFVSLASQVLMIALSFFTTPIFVNKLGTEAYGIVILLGLIQNYARLLSFGLDHGLVRYLGEYYTLKDWGEFRKTFWTGVITQFAIGCLAAILGFLLTPAVNQYWLRPPKPLEDAASVALELTWLTIPLSLAINPFVDALTAVHRLDQASILNGVAVLMQQLLSLAFVLMGYGLVGIASGTLLAAGVSLGLSWIIWKNLRIPSAITLWDNQNLRLLLGYSIWIYIQDLTNQIFFPLDRFFLSKFHSNSIVAYYSVAYNLVSKIILVPNYLTTTFIPILISAHVQKNQNELNQVLLRFVRLITHISLVIFTFLSFFGGTFLELWLGKEFAREGIPVLVIISAVYFLFIPSSSILLYYYVQGRSYLNLPSTIISRILFVLLLYLLVPELSILGVCLAHLASSVVSTIINSLIFRSLGGFSPLKWIGILLNRHFVIIVGMAGLFYLLGGYLDWKLLIELIVFGGLFLLLSAAYLWIWALEKSEKTILLEFLRKVIPIARS